PHGVALDGQALFFTHVRLHGGPAPVRRYLPHLIDLVWKGTINPGRVFDLTLPLDRVADGYRAMDERRAIKTLLRPSRRKTAMQTRMLGQSRLDATALGFGCMGISFGYGAAVGRDEGIGIIRAAVDRGVTFFDTAQASVPSAHSEA